MRELEELEELLELQGLTRGTPEFERALLRDKVAMCMQVQNVSSCTECGRFSECELRLTYWRDIALGPEYANEVDDEAMDETEGDISEEE